MALRDIIGLGAAVIMLAGFSMAVTHGTDVGRILTDAGNSFARVIGAATLRS